MNYRRWLRVSGFPIMIALLVGAFIQPAPLCFAEPYSTVYGWGSSGSGDGEFSAPAGVAFGESGGFPLVYVADTGNHRIQCFESDGDFWDKWGSEGSGDGQFNDPEGVAVDADGSNVYVADTGNNRIQKFDSSGNFGDKWGSEGSDDGQFNYPYAVAVDASGNVYVADTGNNRIQKFDSSGNFILKWGSEGLGDGQFIEPRGVAVNADGNVYVADRGNSRIQRFTSYGNFITKWGSEGSGDGQFYAPHGIAVDASGNVYVADIQNNRIQAFISPTPYLAVNKWGSGGSGDGQFIYPYSVAVDPDGIVCVADTGNHRIQKFNIVGDFFTKWGSYGSDNGSFDAPGGVAVDASGNIYVADTGNHRIQKFDSSGNFTTKWGSYGSDNGSFNDPRGVAVDADGNVYVADTDNHRIQKFDSSGNFTTRWGSEGGDNCQFKYPKGVAVDASGNVHVADTENYRIQVFIFEFTGLPTVTTSPATGVTDTSATLNGTLVSLGTASSVNVSFEYGTTTSYGSTTAVQAKTELGPFSANITGLPSGTAYYFRAKAEGDGIDYGDRMTFTTVEPPSAPQSPLCEGVTNPTGVTDPTPEFSWTFSDPDAGDTQGAYQVLVASTSANLTAGTGDMWNSGKVVSSANLSSYAGAALAPNQTYYWKVKTWDNHDAEGDYCGGQHFTMATSPSEVWVNHTWAGTGSGDPADGHTFGYDAFAAIQDGIEVVAGSGTVNVHDGTYTENVDINKSLTVKSVNGADVTTVAALNVNDHVFEVTANYVNISGFTVTDATASNKAGIFLNAEHCNIYNVRSSNNWGGIVVQAGGSTNVIHFNNIAGNTPWGVYNETADNVSAENNWWGDGSGPYHATTNPTGTGDNVTDKVNYSPWLGAGVTDCKSLTTSSDNVTVDAKTETDTEVLKKGTGTPTITVVQSTGNPGGSAPGGFTAVGKYIDVHIDDTTDVDEIEIRNYYTSSDISGLNEATLKLSWWNGTSWIVCSNSGVTYPFGGPTYKGYVWAKITDNTTPTLADLAGTPFMPMGIKPPPASVGGGAELSSIAS